MSKYDQLSKDMALRATNAEWLAEVPGDPHSAHCTKCHKNISLSNMGRGAIVSHVTGQKHKLNTSGVAKEAHNPIMTKFVLKIGDQKDSCISGGAEKAGASASAPQTANSGSMTDAATRPTTKNLRMEQYLKDKQTQVAEILWVVHCVMNHYSYSSNSNTSKLFTRMFSDSEIAAQYRVGSTKVAYMISYGLAHGFKETLLDTIKDRDAYSVTFDEAFNKILQEDQMDIHLKFWMTDIVASRYLDSQFLGHATAEDLLEGLINALSSLDERKLLQIGMDGPNVNLKLFNLFRQTRKEKNEDLPDLIDIGVCSLHVVHGAILTGLLYIYLSTRNM